MQPTARDVRPPATGNRQLQTDSLGRQVHLCTFIARLPCWIFVLLRERGFIFLSGDLSLILVAVLCTAKSVNLEEHRYSDRYTFRMRDLHGENCREALLLPVRGGGAERRVDHRSRCVLPCDHSDPRLHHPDPVPLCVRVYKSRRPPRRPPPPTPPMPHVSDASWPSAMLCQPSTPQTLLRPDNLPSAGFYRTSAPCRMALL